MNLAEIRKQYPQYNDLSDEELAKGLHKANYSDMSFDEFASKIGYEQPKEKKQDTYWVDSDWVRKPLSLMQGTLNSNINPVGFMAKGLNYSFGSGRWELPESLRAIEPKDKAEKILANSAKVANDLYGTYAIGAGLGEAGLLGKGVTTKSKIANVLLNPENAEKIAYLGAQGNALADYVDPESGLARFGLEMIGASPIASSKLAMKAAGKAIGGVGSLARKGMALASGVSDDVLKQAYNIGKDAGIAEKNINYLTSGPNDGILNKVRNIKNKFSGGYYEKANNLLEKESSRLSRQANKDIIIGGQRNTYNGRSDGTLGSGLKTWSASDATKNTYSKLGIDTPDFIELPQNEHSAQQFRKAILDAKKVLGKSSATVDVHSLDDYSKMRLFLTKDGKTGFAINPKNGDDVISVFNIGKKGLGDVAVDVSLSAGGKKLDAYDTFLPEIYSRHGFKPVDRASWLEKYKPSDWSKSEFKKFNYGEPDVVWMQYDPAYKGGYSSPNSLTNMVNKEVSKLNAQKTFKSNLKGETSIDKVVDDAEDALRKIQQKASETYAPLKEKLFQNKTKLDLADINKKANELSASLYDRGELIGDEKTLGYLEKMLDAVKRHSKHPDIKGLDSMRRSVQSVEIPFENKIARRAQKSLSDVIKDTIVKQNPEYKQLVGDYASTQEVMKNIRQALNIGNKSQNRSTAARSIMQAVRDNVNANFGSKKNALKMLEELGGKDLTAALVGQELSPILPKGIQRGVAGLGVLSGVSSGFTPQKLFGLAAMSPRVDAYITNLAGKVSGRVPKINIDQQKLIDAAKAVGISELIKNSTMKGE